MEAASHDQLSLPNLGFGTGRLSYSICSEGYATYLLGHAVEAGISYFDTADSYGDGTAERMVGNLLRQFPSTRLKVSTKVGFGQRQNENLPCFHPRNLEQACLRSIDRLGVTALDLYLIHRPIPDLELMNLLANLAGLFAAGLIRTWGVCDWSPALLLMALVRSDELGLPPPRVCLFESHVFCSSFELNRAAALARLPIHLVGYSPLAGGLITGKYLGDIASISNPHLIRIQQRCGPTFTHHWLESVAATGLTPTEAAIRWARRRTGIRTILFGASTVTQIDEVIAAHQRDDEPEPDNS